MSDLLPYFTALAGLLGLAVGSFLNVLIYRLPLKLSFARGRSFCPSCRASLKWYDMVPVLSWLLLRGRCRTCGCRISPRYPIVELLGGALFALTAWKFGFSLETPLYIVFFCALIVIAFIDTDTMEIPNGGVLIILALAVADIFAGEPALLSRGIGALCLSLPLLIMAIFGGVGGGDVKLMFACGALLGWKLTIVAGFLAFVTAAVWALVLLAKHKAGRKSQIPFGMFLAAGTTVSVFAGERLIALYLGLFGL